MNTEFLNVTRFMVLAEQATPSYPTVINRKTAKLRTRLIMEELLEFAQAVGMRIIDLKPDGTYTIEDTGHAVDLKEAYDAILDLLVVVIGSAVAMGTPLDAGWKEVHNSNMSKFIDGHKDPGGKWVKGPSYTPANLQPILDAMLAKGGLSEPLVQPDE